MLDSPLMLFSEMLLSVGPVVLVARLPVTVKTPGTLVIGRSYLDREAHVRGLQPFRGSVRGEDAWLETKVVTRL